MIALSGLRGVGKTTLAWQTAAYVYQSHVKQIFFLSVDELKWLNAGLYEAFQALEQVLGRPLHELTQPIMLIIDEVHEAQGWQRDLKILYEKAKKVFVLVTGSSALLLHSSADLASRWTLTKVFPFRFPEFIVAKTWISGHDPIRFPVRGLARELRNAFFFAYDYQDAKQVLIRMHDKIDDYFEDIRQITNKSIKELIDEYISYHNIARFVPITNKTLVIERVLALFERILLKDIPELHPGHSQVYNRILFRLALSDTINYQTLSKEFNIKQAEVEKIINSLHQAEILNVFLPHGSVRAKTGKLIKPFFMSPSLRRALYSRIYGDKLAADLRAKLYEDTLAMYLKRTLSQGIVSFGFGKKKNPDFVVETMDRPVLVEVGSGQKTGSQIKTYDHYRYGMIVRAALDQPKFDDPNRIIFIPLKWFLLI